MASPDVWGGPEHEFHLYSIGTVNVEIFDARKFRALWTGPIIFYFRAH